MYTTHSSTVACLGRLNREALKIALFIAFARFTSISFEVCRVPLERSYVHSNDGDLGEHTHGKYDLMVPSFLARSSASILAASVAFVIGRELHSELVQMAVKFSCRYPVPSSFQRPEITSYWETEI